LSRLRLTGAYEPPCQEKRQLALADETEPDKLGLGWQIEKDGQNPQKTNMNMIEVNELTKRFGQLTAVDNISFQVDKGEIFGLIGPNGAGKTTTIRCLLTLIKPTSGKVKISEMDILKQPTQVRQLCGYVPQDISVDGDLTGYENLLFYAKLFYVPRDVRKKRIKEVLDFLQISDYSNKLVKTYSGGMMRRLEIGQVLVNQPGVLFLDEPSIGLDPATKHVIWDYIIRLRDQFAVTILLTTHDMNEADTLCDRIAIMNSGKISVIGSPQELKAGLGGDVVSIAADSGAELVQVLERLEYHLSSGLTIHRDESAAQNGSCDIIIKEADREIPRIIDRLKDNGIAVRSISLKRATLDDVFLKYAGKRIGQDDAEETAWQDVRRTRRNIRKLGA
jgi:ABC-2 type transport system ATP-binding protein